MDKHQESRAEAQASKRPLAIRIAKWGIFAVVLYFVGRLLVGQLRSVDWSQIRFTPLFLILAAVTGLAGRGLNIFAYRLMLRTFGMRLGLPQIVTVAWLPIAGKYIPGKVASVAGAVWLLRRNGVPTSVAVSVIFMLNALLVLVGLLLGVPLSLWGPVRAVLPMGWVLPVLVLAAGIALLHPRIFLGAVNFLLKKFKHQELPSFPRLRDYVGPVAVMLIQCALTGTALWFLTRSIVGISPARIPFFISASALAGSVGFIAVFAPGGIGVREGILAAFLTPVIGPTAAIAVVAYRILHVFVELTLVLTGLWALKAHPPVAESGGTRPSPLPARVDSAERG